MKVHTMGNEVELTREPSTTQDQIERAENVQVLVALGVISGYLSIKSGRFPSFKPFMSTADAVSVISFLFLTGKLITLTFRPYRDHWILQKADRKWLPGAFVIAFVVSFATIPPTILPLPAVDFQRVILKMPEYVPSLFALTIADAYIVVWAILSILIGWRYATWTDRTMAELETAVPNVQVSFTSGSRGRTFPLTLKNPYDEEIPARDIQIAVSPSSGVEVDIPQAKKIDDNTWRPRLAIPPREPLQIRVKITRKEGKTEIDDESVEIETSYLGRPQKRHTVDLEG